MNRHNIVLDIEDLLLVFWCELVKAKLRLFARVNKRAIKYTCIDTYAHLHMYVSVCQMSAYVIEYTEFI